MTTTRGDESNLEGAPARPGVAEPGGRRKEEAAAAGAAGSWVTTLRRPWTRRYIGWAIVVAVPSLVLRLLVIDALGVNSDEAVYAGQAASLARDPAFLPFFPVFRAHPLLFQSLLSLQYRAIGVTS